MTMKTWWSKTYGNAAKAVPRGKFIAIPSLPQETGKISNKQSNLTPKGTRERRTNKTQS